MIILIVLLLWQNEGVTSVSPNSVNTSVWAMRRRTTLHSVEPDQNRFRFFIVELWAPPIGTGAALRKRWGRIGHQGRTEVLYFDRVQGAEHYLEVLLRRRRKRGYVEVEPKRWKLLELEAEAEARLRQLRRQLCGALGVQRRAHAESEQLALWS